VGCVATCAGVGGYVVGVDVFLVDPHFGHSVGKGTERRISGPADGKSR